MQSLYPTRLIGMWNVLRGNSVVAKDIDESTDIKTPRGRFSITLEDATVSADSRSNQSEKDTSSAKHAIFDMLRETTDARVHVSETRVSHVGLYTDFILSQDSHAEPNRSRILDYVKQRMNQELFEVFSAEHYVATEMQGFPVPHYTMNTTLVVRKHAVLLIYTPLRWWFSRLTFATQCLVLLFCLYVIVYMLRF
jgi:hypothetical protein